MAISIDAGKVREKLVEHVTDGGKKKYDIGFRDVKMAAISEVFWDDGHREAYCSNHSYVGGIEHADEFFPRVWVEMTRRGLKRKVTRCVFLADGAKWIWDRLGDLDPGDSVFILDFFHACEHVSDVCKELYGEGSEAYTGSFARWRSMILRGAVVTFLAELKQILEQGGRGTKRADLLQGEVDYFNDNRERMHYDQYQAQGLPIGRKRVQERYCWAHEKRRHDLVAFGSRWNGANTLFFDQL